MSPEIQELVCFLSLLILFYMCWIVLKQIKELGDSMGGFNPLGNAVEIVQLTLRLLGNTGRHHRTDFEPNASA